MIRLIKISLGDAGHLEARMNDLLWHSIDYDSKDDIPLVFSLGLRQI